MNSNLIKTVALTIPSPGDVSARVNFIEVTSDHVIVRLRFESADQLPGRGSGLRVQDASGNNLEWRSTIGGGDVLSSVADYIFERFQGVALGDHVAVAFEGQPLNRIELNGNQTSRRSARHRASDDSSAAR